MASSLKMALVGCGAISRVHLPAIREGAPRIEITAAIDADRERAESMARELGGEAFTSLEDGLVRGDFDAVDLMLPHHLHEEAAVRAFAAGKHVLLEKPMATSLDACERIVAAWRRAGTVFMVAENAQYWPEVLAAKSLIDAGAVGDIVTARGSFAIPPMAAYYGGERPWRLENRAAGGGIALDTGSHWIRPLRMLLGEVDAAGGGIALDTGSHWIRPLRILLGEVDAAVGALGRPYAAMQGESLVRALLRFRSGVVAVLDGIMKEGPFVPEPMFRVTGSAGEITIERPGRVMLWTSAHPEGQQVGEVGGYQRSYPGEFADFAAAVLEGRPLAAGPEVALGELRVALAIYRSAESGRWEKVWE